MRTLLLTFLIFCTLLVCAQEKVTITGNLFTVVGEGNNTEKSPLPFANVWIDGTTIGATSDIDGVFKLVSVPLGQITIKASFVGFREATVKIVVTEDFNQDIEIELRPQAIMGKEVVITGQLLGQTKAINQQFNSDKIVNIVSEDKIKELPDVNAAEAIARLPGIAVHRSAGEGQKIMIRGLEPKHTSIMVNGVKLPSNDPTDKSVDLSMISSDMLAGIEVFKSPTPDMDADAIGGTVNLMIKKAPANEYKPTSKFRIGGGYNALQNQAKDFYFSGQVSRRFFNDKIGIIAQGNFNRVNRSSDIFGGRTNLGFDGPESTSTENAELTDRSEIRKRYGGSINLDYSVKNHSFVFNSFFSKTDRDITERTARFSPADKDNVFYTVIEDRNIDMGLFSNSLQGKHIFNQLKIDWNISASKTSNLTPYNLMMRFPDDNAFDDPTVLVNQDNSYKEIIDDAMYDVNRSYLRNMAFFPDSVVEKNKAALINFQYDFNIGKKIKGYLKMGGKYASLNRERNIYEMVEPFYYLGTGVMNNAIERYPENIDLNEDGLISLSNFYDDDYKDDDFLRGKYPFDFGLSPEMAKKWYESQKDNLTEDRKRRRDPYSTVENIASGYLMGNLKIGNILTIITGLRYETTNNEYNANYSTISGILGEFGTIRDTTTNNQYDEWFPHLHLKIKPFDWYDIKLSVAKTIARPDYNYIAPRTLINNDNNTITTGNPDLKHMTSWNFDANMTFMDMRYGLFSIGAFYKKIDNVFFANNNFYLSSDSIAAHYGFPEYQGYFLNSYENRDDSYTYGYELEFQTNLKWLPKPFNSIVINVNYGRLFSQTSKKYYNQDTIIVEFNKETFEIEQTPVYSERVRKISIPGQVPHTLNVSLGYDYKGFSGRISGVYQGFYLLTPANLPVMDVYRNKYWRFDISLKQQITKNISAYCNIVNLDFGINNHDEEEMYGLKMAIPRRLQDYGNLINFGIEMNF